MIVSRRSPPTPSKVFQTYWHFAAERQAIYFARVFGAPAPWTSDPILQEYRFTNVYRASDRVSQYLIRNVIYDKCLDEEDIVFRILLFKFFNKIETWEYLEQELGAIRYAEFSVETYSKLLTKAMTSGKKIYSAAYIMPSGTRMFQVQRKHQAHLMVLDRMMKERLPCRLSTARSMEEAFAILRAYPLIGDFLAFQFLIDLNYSELLDFNEMDFVMAGPGALSGIRKCFDSLGDLTVTDTIRWVADQQADQFQRSNVDFRTLWGRPLQLVDCQNLFCEVDKYSRVKHPDVAGISNRSRIKQRYKSAGPAAGPWFPPNWNLNDLIASDLGAGS